MSTAVSVYQLAMGADFALLQPELQHYFSLTPGEENDGGATLTGVGSGTFKVAGCPVPVLRPFLGLTSSDNALFPEYQHHVPFTIENRASRTAGGLPQLTAIRTLHFENRTRVMEDRTSWDDNLGKAVGALDDSRRLAGVGEPEIAVGAGDEGARSAVRGETGGEGRRSPPPAPAPAPAPARARPRRSPVASRDRRTRDCRRGRGRCRPSHSPGGSRTRTESSCRAELSGRSRCRAAS